MHWHSAGISLVLAFAVLTGDAAERPHAIATAAELFTRTYDASDGMGRPFSLTATVTLPCCERRHRTMAVEDASGATLVTLNRAKLTFSPQRGDLIRLDGLIAADAFGHACAACTSACLVARSAKAPAIPQDPKDLSASDCRCRTVQIRGTVADAFPDEIDSNYVFLILNGENLKRIVVATEADGRTADDCRALIGKTASVLGVCRPNMYGVRTHFGTNIRTTPENIRIAPTPFADPFEAPRIGDKPLQRPDEIVSTERRTVCGTVVAVWPGGRALVRTRSGQIARIALSHGDEPEQGDSIEASGFPETDLYRINLTRCLWRKSAEESQDRDTVRTVSAAQLMSDPSGLKRYDPEYHGRHVRLGGRLLGFAPREGRFEAALLESDGQHIPVYFDTRRGSVSGIPANCLVEIDGTCVMDTESWSPNAFFPRIREVFVSVAGPEHVRIVSKPSWWTPGRLSAVCAALLVLLLWFVFWNRMLNRTIARKGRELKREITARVASDLKTRERTRLAVELHDSLSQTLSGTAMEIGSAMRCAGDASAEMMAHLRTATQTLRSCRDDLRDCLWDLRSNALEAGSMDEAIRTTLRPVVGDRQPIVRFNVRRKRLSDNTAHAILRIIHELVSNAIRHGHAETIRVAGSLDGRRLLFSVRDDGCGFDARNHPGAREGHFGLEGIRERIRPFNGTMEIDSSPETGTKVSLALDVNRPEEEDRIES